MATLYPPYIIERSSRGERTYDIFSRLLMDRIVFLGAPINDDVANIIIAQFFLTIMSTIGGAWSFGIFAILAVLAWIFVWRLAPETKGRELEEIQEFWENGGSWPTEESTGRSR